MVHKTLSKESSLAIVKCSNAQDMAGLLQAFENLSRASSLLLEIHRRGAAAVLLEYIAATMPM